MKRDSKSSNWDSSETERIAAVFNAYSKVMYQVAYRWLGSKEEAEDAVQEAFCKVLKNPSMVLALPKEDLQAYVQVLCRNVIIDQVRSNKQKIVSLEEAGCLLLPDSNNVEEAVLNRVEIENLLRLPSLPNDYRDILVLRHYYNLSFREIAFTLKITESNARKKWSRAIKKMREIRNKAEKVE